MEDLPPDAVDVAVALGVDVDLALGVTGSQRGNSISDKS